jgi:DNA gyrase subunit A
MNIDEIVRILYKKARLIDTFTVQMLYVDDYQLRTMSLKEVMQSWIDNRRIMKDKFITHDLVQLRERQHVLDALIDITSDIDKSKKMIEDVNKSSEETMIPKLMKRFKKLTSLQAAQILDMKIKSFNTSRHQKYVDEFNENKKTIKHYEKMVLHPSLIDDEIIKELQDAIKKYAQPRRCKIEKPSALSDSKIMNTEYNIVFTKKGLVKKINGDSQGIGKLNDGDEPLRVCRVKNSDSLVCFDRSGLIHTIKVSDISQTQLKDTGIQIGKYANIRSDVVMAMPLSETKPKGQFVFVTEKGMIKRTSCSKYAFKSSVIAINLKENDGLARVVYSDKENSDIIVFTKQGVGNRFNLLEFQETNRASYGVIGIDIAKDDAVMGAVLVGKKDTSIAILTDRGNGKVCDLDTFTTGKRRGAALRVIKVNEKEKLLDVIPCNSNDKFLVVMKKDIVELKYSDFPYLTRNHHGKKMIGVPLGDYIIRFLKK